MRGRRLWLLLVALLWSTAACGSDQQGGPQHLETPTRPSPSDSAPSEAAEPAVPRRDELSFSASVIPGRGPVTVRMAMRNHGRRTVGLEFPAGTPLTADSGAPVILAEEVAVHLAAGEDRMLEVPALPVPGRGPVAGGTVVPSADPAFTGAATVVHAAWKLGREGQLRGAPTSLTAAAAALQVVTTDARADRAVREVMEAFGEEAAAVEALGVDVQRILEASGKAGARGSGTRPVDGGSRAHPVGTSRGSAAEHYRRGQELARGGDPAGAAKAFTEVIRLVPGKAPAWCDRGVVRMQQGDLDGALEDLDRAVRLEPDYARGYLNRGVVRKKRGELDGALADFDQALRLKPGYAAAYSGRGTVWLQRGEAARARQDFRRALESDPADAVARRGLEAVGDSRNP